MQAQLSLALSSNRPQTYIQRGTNVLQAIFKKHFQEFAKVYEVDPMICDQCGSPMRILAIITNPQEVKKILHHLVKTGKPPPGLDASSLN